MGIANYDLHKSLSHPRLGKLKTPLLGAQGYRRLFSKPGVRANIALHAAPVNRVSN